MNNTKAIHKLIIRIENSASEDVSLKDVRALVKTHDPEAIDALAGLLDDAGAVGKEAAKGLARFGREAEATLRRCVGSENEVVARRAAELLARLGDDEALRNHEVFDQENEAAAVVAQQVAGNDNEVEPAADLSLLTDHEIVRLVASALKGRGILEQDLDAAVSEVQTRILELLRVAPAPRGFGEWKALALRMARAFAVDQARQRKRRRRWEEDLSEEEGCDAFPSQDPSPDEVIDRRRVLGVFTEMADAGELSPRAGELIGLVAKGYTDEEIGIRLDLARESVRDRRRLIRRRMKEGLLARGMAELIPRDDTRRRRQATGDEACDAEAGDSRHED